MATTEQVRLLHAAVSAKVVYWQALRELEKATAPDGDEWSDRATDVVIEKIETLAVGCDTTGDVKWIGGKELRVIQAAAQG